MKKGLPILALITASVIWGAAAPIFKWSIQNIPIFPLVFVRFFIASIFLIPFLKTTKIKLSDFASVCLLGIFGITINSGLFFLGISMTSSINAGLMAASGPIFTILAAKIFLKENGSKRLIVGALVGLLGVLLISGQSILKQGLSTDLLGNLCLIFSIWGTVGHEIMVKKLQLKYDSVLLTYAMFLVGALTFLPLAYLQLVQNPSFLLHIDIRGVTGVTFGILLSSLAAYFLWNWGLSKMPAGKSGIFLYADPAAAALIALPLLGEKLTTTDVIGAALIFLGIFIAERRIHYHLQHFHLSLKLGKLRLSLSKA
jgi:drug/metabolite transporter (DMT)-like permease